MDEEMAGPDAPTPHGLYDRTLKRLLDLLPEEISQVAFGEGLGSIFERRPTDLRIPSKQTIDGVLLVGVAGTPGFHVRHIEFETRAQAGFPERLMCRNVLLRQQYDATVRTVAFLLKPPDAEISGVYEEFWGGEPLIHFQYRVVRVYATPWKKLAASLALAPLVPLGEGFAEEPEEALQAALKTLGTRFDLRGLLLDVVEAMSVPASLQDKLFREEDQRHVRPVPARRSQG